MDLEDLEACGEMSIAFYYLKEFASLVISTGDRSRLQILSNLALKHISGCEKHCTEFKEEMEQKISENSIRRHQLERKIRIKDRILLNVTTSLESKTKEVFNLEAELENAHKLYNEKEQNYIALDKKYKNQKFTFMGVNILTAGLGLGITIMTAGTAAPVAIGLQSSVTVGSGIALKRAIRNLNSAKDEYTKCIDNLHNYRKENIKLKDDCLKLQSEYETCRKEQHNISKQHSNLLERLAKATTLLECLLNCRHFISRLQGRIEVLQEARKDIDFQHSLRLPLEEIDKHLSSLSHFNSNTISEFRKICLHFP